MICRSPLLNEHQSHSFDRFLLGGTGKVLNALETMFELEVETSESLLEIVAANDSDALREVRNEWLYTVSSDLQGELEGSVQVLMRSTDIDHLAELLRPLLSLLFLSCPNTDLETLDTAKPGWLDDQITAPMKDAEFRAQMLDMLTEMGNVLIGLYSRAMFELSTLSAHHSMPLVDWHANPGTLMELLGRNGTPEQLCLVIDNQFLIAGHPIHMWCVISLSPGSFRNLLQGIDACADLTGSLREPPRFAQVVNA